MPAAILFGATIAVVRAVRWNVLLPMELGTWILPGIVHVLTPVAIYSVDMTPPPKGLFNLIDPAVVAVLCWLVFVARIAWARKRPQSNRPAAYAAIALNLAIALGVVFFLPPLPQ
ncbi:MAG TPA: hypothetical protein VM183_14885 [Burkholderiales bacterium]|nr:hypothetical protein [Burkholderiales bacterium]